MIDSHMTIAVHSERAHHPFTKNGSLAQEEQERTSSSLILCAANTETKKTQHIKNALICLSVLLITLLHALPLQADAKEVAQTKNILETLKSDSLSIRVEKLPLPNLLRSISKRAGINIIISDTIKESDTITLDLQDTTLFDIFQVIVDTKNLEYKEKNNIIHVSKKQKKETITTNVCPDNSDISDLQKQIKPLLSADGVLTLSARTNCYIIQDTEEKTKKIKEMLEILDQPISQVHIKASIVKVTQEAKRQLGISWDFQNYGSAGKASKRFSKEVFSETSVNPPTKNLGIVFGYLDTNFALDFTLNALQQDNLALVLSSPQILVKDGKNAKIKQGTEIAFETTTTDGATNTTFKDADLSLDVTPKIQGKLISLKLTVKNDSVGSDINNNASVDSQEITTDLLLRDGVTAVIGGIILKSDDKDDDSVPGLSKIPILGHLFKSTKKENKRDELLVFITSNIISFGKELPITPKTDKYLKETTRSQFISGEKINLSPMERIKEKQVPIKQELILE